VLAKRFDEIQDDARMQPVKGYVKMSGIIKKKHV